MTRTLLVTILLAAGTTLAGPAAAQTPPDLPRVGPRPSFEYFVARNRLEHGGGASRLDGVGGRVLWPLAAAHAVLSRMAVGGYLTRAGADGQEPDLLHYGVQADLRLSRSPLMGRLDPLLSLGVGAVRVEEPAGGSLLTPLRDPRGAEPAPHTRTDPSLVPGVGARLHLFPGIGFRGDARLVVDFRERTSRSLELAGGISLET